MTNFSIANAPYSWGTLDKSLDIFGRYPSDHYFVTAQFALTAKK